MVKIKFKKSPYGFIYPDELPKCGFSEIRVPVDRNDIAVTGDYSDIAKNHCACICAMNTLYVLKNNSISGMEGCNLSEDRLEVFKEVHKVFKNGPVAFFKPKINKLLAKKGSGIKFGPVKKLEDIEVSLKEKKPVAMLLNAGIFEWHWVLVTGVRLYMDQSVYLNILDGWNKTCDRYLKYEGRQTFIRALKPN